MTEARCPECGLDTEIDEDGFAEKHKRPMLVLPSPEVKRGRYLRHATPGGIYMMRCARSGTRIA